MSSPKNALKFKLMMWLGILGFIAIIAGVGYLSFNAFNSVAHEMWLKNWGKYLNVTNESVMKLKCFINANCTNMIGKAWMARVPEYYWYSMVIPLVFAAYAKRQLNQRPAGKNPGEGRWAVMGELKEYFEGSPDIKLNGHYGVLVDKTRQNEVQLRVPLSRRCAHTLVVGGIGAGKTSTYLKPNILADAMSGHCAVVFDLKFPDADQGLLDSISFFKAWGREVKVYIPFHPKSLRLPLIKDIHSYKDAFDIANIFRPKETRQKIVPFYHNNERALLAGLIYGFAKEGKSEIAEIYWLLNNAAATRSYIKHRPEVLRLLSSIIDLKDDIFIGLCTGLAGDLQIFTDDNVNRATSQGLPEETLSIEDFLERPGLLFMGLPQHEIENGNASALLQLLKRAIDTSILKVVNTHKGKLPVHLSLYMDEFPSFGELPNIDRNLATLRSRGVAMHIVVQNTEQVADRYGSTKLAAMMNNNFGQMVLFPKSFSLEQAQYWSGHIGFETVTEISEGESVRGGFMTREHSNSTNYREAKRSLLSPEAMAEFPDGVVKFVGTQWTRVHLTPMENPQHPFHEMYIKIKQKYTITDYAKTENNRIEPQSPIDFSTMIKNPIAESFRTWIELMLRSIVPMNIDVSKKGISTVLIKKIDISHLNVPSELEEWKVKSWVEETEEGYKITKIGLSRIEKYKDALKQHGSNHRLLRWVNSNRQALVGHTANKPDKKALGLFEFPYVYISPENAKKLVAENSKHELIERDLNQEKTMLVSIPVVPSMFLINEKQAEAV